MCSLWIEEGTRLARPPEVVAHGTVDGIPWSIEAWVTEPAPGANWWDVMVAVGLQMAFNLGHQGFLGGGGIGTLIPEDHHLTLGGHLFGRVPSVGVWCGCVADDVTALEVRLSDGRVKRTEPQPSLEGFSRFFALFTPSGVAAELSVIADDGSVFERHDLPQHEVDPDANAGMSIVSAGWRDDRPPPGWPQDEHAFGPGEGPRQDEDFLLHVVRFPLYVLPPDTWAGFSGMSGHSGTGEHAGYEVTQVRFQYLDRVGDPTRGMEIVCVSAAEEQRLERAYRPHREEGIWWLDDPSDSAMSPELPGRFRTQPDAPHRDWRIPRARMYLGSGQIAIEGQSRPYERWAYLEHPELTELRVQLPDVVVRIEAWDVADEEVFLAASRLERMTLGSDLLRRMTEAAAATGIAWGRWSQT